MSSRQPGPTTVTIDNFDDVPTLDPHRGFDTASRHPILNLYDGLLALDDRRQFQPCLAAALPTEAARGTEWEVIIPVRDDVTFHDGRPLTVDDVVYSLRRTAITADGPASLWADALLGAPLPALTGAAAHAMVSRITACVDGVRLRLPSPYGPLAALLVQWALVVQREWCVRHGEWDGDPTSLPRHLRPDRTALDDRAMGTGPYRLDGWDRAGRRLTFHRATPDGTGPDRVVLRAVDDRMVREQELLEGACDFSVCQPESRTRLGDLDGVVLEKLPQEWSINPLGFLTQRLDPGCAAVGTGQWGPDGLPPDALTDIHLRRALSLCFDHARYVTEVLDGEALVHRPPFPAPALPAVTGVGPRFDLAEARTEFARAWQGRPAREGCRIVVYTHRANVSRERAAEFLAEGLAAVSRRIVVEVVPLEIGPLVELLYSGAAPVAWLGWASDFLHPYAFASALADPRAPLPAALGIDDPVLTGLVTAARNAPPDREAALYGQLADRVAEQALFLAPPGKVSYLTYQDRWAGVRLKNHVPNVLDFSSFQARNPTSGER